MAISWDADGGYGIVRELLAPTLRAAKAWWQHRRDYSVLLGAASCVLLARRLGRQSVAPRVLALLVTLFAIALRRGPVRHQESGLTSRRMSKVASAELLSAATAAISRNASAANLERLM